MPKPVEELRKVVNVYEAEFEPYGLQGVEQAELKWANISYDEKTGQGCFLIRFEPGARPIAHEHTGFEEFLILEGDLVDSDGREYKPGSKHSSVSRTGMLAAVILREGSGNRTLGPDEEINIR